MGKALSPLGVALLVAVAIAAAPGAVRGQESTLYFLTVKTGVQTPSGDTLFNHLEATHGPLQGDRQVQPVGIELDIYGVSPNRLGLGLGVEVHRYEKTFRFQDPTLTLPPEEVFIRAQGVLFTLKTYLRLGAFFPFVAAGLGNYHVNYQQRQEDFAIRDATDMVTTLRAGFRLLLGRLGLLMEAGNTMARVRIAPPVTGSSMLELGGTYASVGLSWLW